MALPKTCRRMETTSQEEDTVEYQGEIPPRPAEWERLNATHEVVLNKVEELLDHGPTAAFQQFRPGFRSVQYHNRMCVMSSQF
jgi:hypothetical protein